MRFRSTTGYAMGRSSPLLWGALHALNAAPVCSIVQVSSFRQLLRLAKLQGTDVEETLRALGGSTEPLASSLPCLQSHLTPVLSSVPGELMLQSHESYSRCGLGSPETGLLVELARQEAAHIFGAKITGGGSGGTVCLLARAGPEGAAAVGRVAAAFASIVGRAPAVFSGSSDGAAAVGTRDWCQGLE